MPVLWTRKSDRIGRISMTATASGSRGLGDRLAGLIEHQHGADRGRGRAADSGLSGACATVMRASARCARIFEQHDAGGDREVERIGAAGLRDAQQPVAGVRRVVGQALLLVAHQQEHRPAGIVDRAIVDRALEMGAGDRDRAKPCRQARNSGAVARASGTAKIEPMVARTVSSENGSVVSPTRMTPFAPTASTVRMTVPRLPGSRTRSSATQTSSAGGRTSPAARQLLREHADHHLRIVAPRDLGRARLLADLEHSAAAAPGARRQPARPPACRRPALAKTSVRIDQPRSSASMTSFSPSAMKGVLLVAEFFSASALMSLTSGLARLVTSLTWPGAPAVAARRSCAPPSARTARSTARGRPLSRG